MPIPRALAPLAPLALLAAAAPTLAQDFDFILVDSLNANPLAGEAYLWDIADSGAACGVATVDNAIGYPGLLWTQAQGRRRINVASPSGISTTGWIVGIGDIYFEPLDQWHTPPTLPGTYFQPLFGGVNDAGLAVGSIAGCSCNDSGGVLRRPYLWDPVNGARLLDIPNAKGLRRVNNANTAIGWLYGSAPALADAFIVDLNTGAYTLLADVLPADLGAGPVSAADINELGDVVASRSNSGGTERHAFVYSPATGVHVLPFPGPGYQQYVSPHGLNSAGAVVGEISTTLAARRAFLYTPADGIRDLNNAGIVAGAPAGYRMISAEKINDHGWIVGFGQTAAGKTTGFALVPRTDCPADFNASGAVDSQDFFDFLAAFFAGDADFNHDAATTSQDFFDFLGAFFTGC